MVKVSEPALIFYLPLMRLSLSYLKNNTSSLFHLTLLRSYDDWPVSAGISLESGGLPLLIRKLWVLWLASEGFIPEFGDWNTHVSPAFHFHCKGKKRRWGRACNSKTAMEHACQFLPHTEDEITPFLIYHGKGTFSNKHTAHLSCSV